VGSSHDILSAGLKAFVQFVRSHSVNTYGDI
jgi:hypothetical protein